MLPTIDRTTFPLLVVRFPSVVTPAEVDLHLDEVTDLVTRATGRVAIVVDLTSTDILSPALRENAAAKLRALHPLAGGRVAGVAHVVGSALTLGAITGILWVAPAPYPTFVTRSLEEATVWARRRLESIAPPAGP